MTVLADEYYPKQEVCESIGIDTTKLRSETLKSVCVDFMPTSLQKSTVLEAINDAGENFGYVIEEFKKEEVPLAIVFLAVTESKFNPKYMNKRVYAGAWQLSMFEAKSYGLNVNKNKKIDERRDVKKSTQVFIQVLKKHYQEFGSWPLAMMAYNAGDGRLRGAIRKAGTNSVEALLYGGKKFMPKTTSNYLKKIIIYASSANYPPVYDRINSMVRASEMEPVMDSREDENSSKN